METEQNAKKLTGAQWLLVVFFGLLIGFVNGFLGGGGGMICVPILTFCLKLKDKVAHATAILIMLPISLASSLVYIFNSTFELVGTLLVTGGSVVGGVIGSLLLTKLSNRIIRAIFALIMVAAGIRMLF